MRKDTIEVAKEWPVECDAAVTMSDEINVLLVNDVPIVLIGTRRIYITDNIVFFWLHMLKRPTLGEAIGAYRLGKKWLSEKNYRIFGSILPENQQAVALALAFGFKIVDTTPTYIMVNNYGR